MSNNSCIAVVYHFFAHYRAGVNRELMRSLKYDFLFVGDVHSLRGSGIKVWDVPSDAKFLRTRCWTLGHKAILQSGIVGLSLRRDVTTIVFLGCAQFLSVWIAAALARLTGKRVLFWSHGWTSVDRGVKRVCRLAFYKLAHQMLLYGHYAKQIGVQMGFGPESLHVIYNSLDYASQIAVRQTVRNEELLQVRDSLFGIHAKDPLLICTGRLIGMRRLDLLLDAMCLLKEQGSPVNLLLVGDGPESAKLRERAESGALSVHFYGSCYEERILARLFMAADILVMPGRVGLAAIHSLAYGTPVVIHDDPADQHPEWEAVIPGFNGAYFAHDDSRDLARVIAEWLKLAPDREVLRKQCYEVIDAFYNPASQAARIERALDGKPADDSDWDAFCREHSNPRLNK